jgi:SAM-dependent methyltransferase
LDTTPNHNPANVERFSGFAALYDDVRPEPPAIIVEILTQLAGVDRPRLVLDLGSGTGLSTRIWMERAHQVIGIEPNDEMRTRAESYIPPDAAQMTEALVLNIGYFNGYSHDTGMPRGCADIVTCSQSLHWMEPEETFTEVARILHKGGVFGAYDCDWPPTVNVEAEIAYRKFIDRATRIGEENGFFRGVKHWDKDGHLKRMQASGKFRYTKEILFQNQVMGDAERFVGFALSQGAVATLMKRGLGEEDIGVSAFVRTVSRALGSKPVPMWFSYRMRVGVK